MKNKLLIAVIVAAVVIVGAVVALTRRPSGEKAQQTQADEGAPVPVIRQRVQLADEDAFYADAAKAAWEQFNALWIPKTGLAAATRDYRKLTPWDIGSVLAANYSGHQLGLLSDTEYQTRMNATLHTLQSMPLYREAVFHKMYFADNAGMVGKDGVASKTGYGWSATDLGRLLIWLHIISDNDSQFRDEIAGIVKRIKFSETVQDGYLYGGMLGSKGQLWKFQEGRIGYEQYSARGYDFWGASVAKALDVNANAKPINLLGVSIPQDTRGLDRLNSEPFVMLGLELGFPPAMQRLSDNVLAVQEARFKQTGKLTMVSEDAVNVPPHYFYYYCVLCNGKSFTVDVAETGLNLDKPRWVSTKAAFGYHTLVGSEYTKRIMEEVKAAHTARGWSSGIFEDTKQPTEAYDVNTAAVILEAALYRKLGGPIATASGR